MATTYTLSTNPKWRGFAAYPKGTNVLVRLLTATGKLNLTPSGIVRSASWPASLGTFTGRQLVPATGPGWMEVTDTSGQTGWVRYDLLNFQQPINTIKADDGKKLIQTYLKNEAQLAKLLAHNRVLLDLRSKRISGDDILLTEQKRLELRQKDRQRRILAAKDLIKVTSTIDPFHLVFKPAAIKRWYGINGIGLIPVAVWWIGAGIVAGVVLVSGITYKATADHFRTDAKHSEIDLTKAQVLNQTLSKLDPATRAKVVAEISDYGKGEFDAGAAAAVTEADKKDGGPFAEAVDMLKWGIAGFAVYKILA